MIDSKDKKHEPVFETIDDLANRARALLSTLEERESELSSHLASIRSSSEEVSASIDRIEETKRAAHETRAEIEQLKSAVEKDRSDISGLAEGARKSWNDLAEKAQEIDRLAGRASELLERIEHMLPGASRAELASAFRERRESFRRPKRLWGFIFVLAVLSLIPVGYVNPVTFEMEVVSERALIPYIVERIPFVIPVICLAIYAAMRHRQALRLEEEYAHKEALSKSFEGYRRVLMEIEENSAEKQHTLKLIQRTLNALTLHPGRIYGNQNGNPSASSLRDNTIRRDHRGEDGDPS